MGVSVRVRMLFTSLAVLAALPAVVRAADTDEPNDTTATATAIGPLGSLRTGRSLILGDEDWYRFQVVGSPRTVVAEVAFDTTQYDTTLTLELTNLAGTTIATGALVPAESLYRVTTAPLGVGDYLVRVRYASGIDLFDYSLSVTSPDDTDEPNDTSAAAVSLGRVGTVRGGRVLNFDSDWYRVEMVGSASPLTVELSFDTTRYDTSPALEVHSLQGNLLAMGTLAAPEGPYRAVTAPVAAGEYLVCVRWIDGSAILDYSLRSFRQNDADEPNDTFDAATAVGNVGFVRPARVLNFGDEDWYRIDVPFASDPVTVDVAYDTSAYHSTVSLEVQTLAGAWVATGSLTNASGPVRAVTGPLAAGAYLVRVRHEGGDAVSSYALQSYTALGMSVPPQVETTSGANLDVSIGLHGGIKPYTLGIDSRFVAPPGLVFDAVHGKMTGVPVVAGRYDFMVTCQDAGTPSNSVSMLTTLIVNPRLDVRLGEFTAFAWDKTASRTIPSYGGTAPYAIDVTQGALPQGVSFASGGLAFDGAADESLDPAANVPITIQFTDAAGLSDTVETTCVVCVPLGGFALAEGNAAAGVYFDALKGSTVTLNVATAKKAARRALRLALLGSDGTTPEAVTPKTRTGAGSVSRFVAPASGRYYLVVAGGPGPATQLVASAKVALPKQGAGKADVFNALDTLQIDVGALQGAALSVSAKPDKSGLELRVKALYNPAGVQVALGAGDVTTSGGAVSLSKVLDTSGTWTVILAGSRGGPGRMTWSYKIKQPKSVGYSID